ncbi:hypothetical protein NKH60_30110, partial [Mesorhizobium sp. M1006]
RKLDPSTPVLRFSWLPDAHVCGLHRMRTTELSGFRQRSTEAMKQKARRGELFLTVAIGCKRQADPIWRRLR